MSRNVKYTLNIQPIALPAKSDQDYNGKSLFTAGWGYTKVLRTKTYRGNELTTDGASNVPKIITVQAVVHDANSCRLQGFVEDMCKHCGLDVVLCTYGKERFNKTIMEDACRADSGGICPIIHRYFSLYVYKTYKLENILPQSIIFLS